jgi:hypothetical protein
MLGNDSLENNCDWLDRRALLALGFEPQLVQRLLRASPWTGNGGRRIVPAAELADRVGLLLLEDSRDEDGRR